MIFFVNQYKVFAFFSIFIFSHIAIHALQSDSTKVFIDSSKITIHNVYQIQGKEFSSEKLYSTVNQKLNKPLRVRVLNDREDPIDSLPVKFNIISIPPKSKNTYLIQNIVFTDTNGYAETFAVLGSAEGDYEFSARIQNGSSQNDIVYFRAYARSSNWVFFLVAGLLGGLALFLFGLNMMSEGMKKTAGGRLRSILSTLTNPDQ